MEPWIVFAAASALVLAAVVALVFVRRRRTRAARVRDGGRWGRARAARSGESGTADRLRSGLAATRRRLVAQLDGVLGRGPRPLDVLLADLEEVLIAADVGVGTTQALLEPLRALGADAPPGEVRAQLAGTMERLVASPPPLEPGARPWVILVTGVNGVGKTTTIGKLASLHGAAGRRVLLVAADTFRAAAIDQLAAWAERTGADLVRHAPGADPSAVVFDGLKAAVARGADVVLIDTAGRLHTRTPLMEELRKVARVVAREVPGAPHETLLVVDATTGQNAINQARTFRNAVPLTGVVLTKLDGTARGGVLVALRHELDLPIRYVGVGEAVEDLRPFEAHEFVRALFAEEPSAADGGGRP
jgi:fused signal recognition particle receptor